MILNDKDSNDGKNRSNIYDALTYKYLGQMEIPTRINWTSPFRLKDYCVVFFHFHLSLNRTFSKQTMETLTRHLVLWRLILCRVQWRLLTFINR